MTKIHCSALSLTFGLELYHVGPSLDVGELPAVFYFALSGPDSLCLDPYNQMIPFLLENQVRVFSLTLPAHENGLLPTEALKVWAEEIAQGKQPLEEFLDQAQTAIDYVFHQRLVDRDRLAVAGLSRGGLIAGLLAAREKRIRKLLGFAPVTKLALAQEFHSIAPLVSSYDLSLYGKALAGKQIRFMIGNRDKRVSTRACFECIEQLVEGAHQEKIRSAPIELIITPSIGQQGHGTTLEVFRQGAQWISSW
jgi:dienelactone hydrolase